MNPLTLPNVWKGIPGTLTALWNSLNALNWMKPKVSNEQWWSIEQVLIFTDFPA